MVAKIKNRRNTHLMAVCCLYLQNIMFIPTTSCSNENKIELINIENRVFHK